MMLTLDQLRACAAGCVEIREESDGYFFDRMTPSLREHFSTSETAVIRARCQTGIRLRFTSDTRSLSLAIRFGRAARAFRCVDLVVDGIFMGTFSGQEDGKPCLLNLFSAPNAVMRSFECWLPYSVESWLVSLAIDDGSAWAPLPVEPATWLAIGDSITQGMTCISPSRTYAALAARSMGINHHNTGVGGARMEAGAGEVSGLPGSFATVAFGCNDWNGGKPLDHYERDTVQFLETLFRVRPGIPLGLLTPFPAVSATGEQNKNGVQLEAYREVLRKQASLNKKIRLIEGPSLIPADPGAFADGIHPNNAGMAVLANRLVPHLQILASLV
jgi:lysophospholipase L1-like esterase